MGGLGTQPRLFLNNRNGTFRDASAASGVTLGRSTLGSSFGDYDRDGDLDMALSLYGREPGSEREHLWHNVGGGRFVRGNREAGLHGAFPTDSRTFTTNFADIDNDGFVDLLLTGEGEASRVFLNQADTTLYDVTAPATLSGCDLDLMFGFSGVLASRTDRASPKIVATDLGSASTNVDSIQSPHPCLSSASPIGTSAV